MIRTLITTAAARLLGGRQQHGPRRRPHGYPSTGFRVGPRWTWCPAERAQTPHLTDASGLSCKTTTAREVKTRG